MHDHHLPQFHVRLPRGYLNDPNGPVELGGTTHLYFQSRSYAEIAVPVEWGHATSEDLVHWTLQRPAMSPVPGGLDSDGCWSGNTVVDGESVRAFYSGKVEQRPYQSVLTAVSDRDGANFGPPVQVVDDPAPEEGVTMFRDPFVWRDGSRWRMVVGAAGPDNTASMRQYCSADGSSWVFEGDLARLPRTEFDGIDTGEGWECPQLIAVDGREIAIVSSWSHEHGPGAVLAFPIDASPAPRRVDDGHNFYAASVMRESSYGQVLFGWITEGRGAAEWQTAGWAGAISLPRRAWLDGDQLCSEPHPAVARLRADSGRPASGATVGAQVEIMVPAVSGTVRLQYDEGHWLDIVVDLDADTLTLDRSAAGGESGARAETAMSTRAFSDRTDWAARIFLDGSVIEVFTSAGRSITSRVYPTTPPPWHVHAPVGAVVWDLARSISSAHEREIVRVEAVTVR
ncbi:glycoside hydrolase family 32 protein [Leifsonia sp. ZF2019]|uniref:glycoside hydrolase family 32 protein n=1 Tax=Leifsonia sp. ZF2019 TaxID=2781978 RepID=UPI001CBDAC95|nr:glycoside hydrolase family 32 protein [Leifsonia sp. ZF2019]UAJ79820.1 glycoside hydrolase family 32 protein [Leifsonia sp. ZF2019]